MTELNQTWRDILWREWRNCEDKEYAHYLFKTVAGKPTYLLTFVLSFIFSLFPGLGCLLNTKWYRYDPSEAAPYLSVPFGLIIGLVVGTIFGLRDGLILGLILGTISFYVLMIILMMLPGLRKKIAAGLDYLCKYGEPPMAHVEMALREATKVGQPTGPIWQQLLGALKKQKQQPDPLDKLLDDLQYDHHWAVRFVARYGLVSLGGSAVEPLRAMAESGNIPLDRLAIRLLKNIEIETTDRWAGKFPTLLCPQCLTRCCVHQVALSWQPDLSFCGCRICRQSREFLEGINQVVAVLDVAWPEKQLLRDDHLRVNWLAHKSPFDFDKVEIIQASDEEVEHFTVQVGNDTDPFRQARYSQLPCMIAPTCTLSENTLRILRRTFERVEQRVNVPTGG